MSLYNMVEWVELSIQWMLTCGHFLWQGFAVAIIFLGIERLLAAGGRSWRSAKNATTESVSASGTASEGQSRAELRYGLACVALLALPVCVIATFVTVHSMRGPFVKAAGQAMDHETVERISPTAATPTIELERPQGNVPGETRLAQAATLVRDEPRKESRELPVGRWYWPQARFVAPLLSGAYAIGVSILLSRLILAIMGGLRFRDVAEPVADPNFLKIVVAQATRLKLKAEPVVAQCVRVSSPVVVGVLRPMILLPPALLCGLNPTQMAAILSHEMAHIRRYDLVMNLIQRLIESLLFFHPATWWISRRVSVERENCCDDVAALCLGRLAYAGALVEMASICLANDRRRSQELVALSADGGRSTDLGYRIRRLIDAQESPQIRFTVRSCAIGLVGLTCLLASWATLAQVPQSPPDETPSERPSNDQLVDGIQWSTWGAHEGLLSGARLILPEGGVHPGQLIVVEYRLKNVSAEAKKLTCYVRGQRTHLTLGNNNRISDMGIDVPDESVQVSIEPGEEYVAPSSRASIDTSGLSPGEYQIALGSAFYYPDDTNPGTKHEIPHRGSIPVTIVGEPTATSAQPLDDSIHWGKAVSGLKLGAKFPTNSHEFAIGDVVEVDLWIANVSNQAIECSIRLPHPMDGWWFNVQNELGETIVLERPPFISSPLPQEFYPLKLAPVETKLLTGERREGEPDMLAGPRAKFENVAPPENRPRRPTEAALAWGDHTIKGRLTTPGGEYSAIFHVVLVRPDVPRLLTELNTGNTPFTVGQPNTDPWTARVLDEATDRSILWGESSGGMRLGIRPSEFTRRRSILRHGEHIDYEVWIKNESDEVVHIARDPRDLHRPRLMDDQAINVIGGGILLSFGVPMEELAKSELILPPGHAARRLLEQSHSTSIRPPGSPRGRFGSDPLLLEPGKYSVYAQLGELKSGVDEVEIIPAARLQVRKSSRVTDQSREYAAQDPSEAILSWQTGQGEQQELMVNWDHGVLVDERDLASVEIRSVEGQPEQYAIVLHWQPDSAKWLADRIRSYSLWDDPDRVAILLDGKPLGSIQIPTPIPEDTSMVPIGLSRQQAEAIAVEIRAAMAADAGTKG